MDEPESVSKKPRACSLAARKSVRIPKPCFIHLLMIIGIAITVGYTFFVSRRIRKHSVRLEAAASKVTGSRLDPSSVPVSMPSPQPMNTPAGVER